jgi:hypothetical protein
MKPKVLAFFACVTVASCATMDWPMTADPSGMRDTPASFQALGTRPSESAGSSACLNPLEDPRDGSRITLVRSHGGFGDYAAPPSKYGLAAGELLRVNCRTGQPVGSVRGAP